MARREADGGGQSAQGEVSVVLGVQVAVVSGAFSGCIVREDDAFADQTDETSGADDTESPGVDWKLVPGAKGTFLGGGGGVVKQQSEIDHKKAYGYKKFQTLEIALYHTPGSLPEPKFTHQFFG